jgi:uncharacterized membrane protein
MQVLFTFGALPLIVPAWFRARGRMDQDRIGWGLGALTGATAALANLALFHAMRDGDASVVTPLTALSPLVTFLLARLILKERMNRSQNLGVACAVVAIVLLSI